LNDWVLRRRPDGSVKLKELPADLRESLKPLLEEVESLTEKIKECDKKVELIVRDRYPETKLLLQISGVGPLIAA
jgi:transposase